MDLRKVLAQNIKKYRKIKSLSQEQLADISGLHRTYISGLERGIRNPTILIIWRLAQALKIKPTDLLTKDNN